MESNFFVWCFFYIWLFMVVWLFKVVWLFRVVFSGSLVVLLGVVLVVVLLVFVLLGWVLMEVLGVLAVMSCNSHTKQKSPADTHNT